MDTRGGSSGGGGIAGEGHCYLGGGNGGCCPINVGPAIGLRGTCRTGGGALPGGWAEPAVHGCGGSATGGSGYLATPLTFASCGSAAAHAYSAILFDACGCSCSHLACLGHSHSFLATCGCPCSYPMPSWACSMLRQTKPPAGSLAGQRL